MTHDDNDLQQEKLKNLMGLGSSSIKKSYYPELQNKINELNIEKEKYERIFSDALNGIFQADLNGKILMANPAMVNLCSYSSLDKILSINNIASQLFVRKENYIDLLQQISENASIIGYETKFKTEQKLIIDVSLNASIIIVDDKKLLQFFVQDISERKKAEKSLGKAQNYINSIINSMPSAIIGIDSEGFITQWNKEAENTLHLSKEKALGCQFIRVLPEFENENILIQKAIRDKIKQKGIRRSIKRDEIIHYEDITIFPLLGEEIEGAVIRIDDVSEQVRLEESMVQSDKMLSIGGLAAGLAHEINNPLAGMIQTANVMANRITDYSLPANIKAAKKVGTDIKEIKAYMDERGIVKMAQTIIEAGKRASVIIENMLNFSRKSNSGFSSYNPVDLLEKVLDLAATDFNIKNNYDFKNIKIIKEYEKDLPLVLCDKAKIQQVFLNLLRNGFESMRDYHESAADNESKMESPTFILRINKEKENGMIRIEINDNGSGMDIQTKQRIFDPFFTTKAVGKGTGLGLSVSYFIITENHNGKMQVESQPGKGANFIIRLPVIYK